MEIDVPVSSGNHSHYENHLIEFVKHTVEKRKVWTHDNSTFEF